MHFLCENEKNRNNENKNENNITNNDELIVKHKKEIESLKKCINDMKIRLLTIGNNLNKLLKDNYINNNYKDLFSSLFKLLNCPEEKIKLS